MDATLFANSMAISNGGALNFAGFRPYFNKRNQPVVAHNGRETVVQNALLRKYEWEQIDTAVLDVVRQPNIALEDFLRLGLTYRLDGIGVTDTIYEQLGDMTDASVNMEGLVQGENDRVEFTPQTIKVPMLFKDFNLSLRHLEASRRGNSALDTTQARVATRKVQDKADDLIFNGNTTLGIQGLTTKTQRIQKTGAQCGGGDFGTAGNAYKTFSGAVSFLRAAGYNGPYGFYVSRVQYGQLTALISGTAMSELQAIMNNIPGISFIKPSDKLTDGTMLGWQLSPDVADLAIAQDVTPVQWDALGGFEIKFRVFTVLTVRVKHDANNACGVIHVTSI